MTVPAGMHPGVSATLTTTDFGHFISSYSCASPVLMTMLVTHDPEQTWIPNGAFEIGVRDHLG